MLVTLETAKNCVGEVEGRVGGIGQCSFPALQIHVFQVTPSRLFPPVVFLPRFPKHLPITSPVHYYNSMGSPEVMDFARLKTIFNEATDSEGEIKEVTENSQEDDSCMGQIATILTSEQKETRTQGPKPSFPTSNRSHDSSKSLSTVIQHDSTPSSQAVEIRSPVRPQSAMVNVRSPSLHTQSTRDEVDEIASLTSQDALKSLYSLLSSKLGTMQDNPLSPKDRKDIQAFFQTQKKSFCLSLRSNLGSRPLV